MISSAKKFGKHLKADGKGAFGRIEYDGDRVILRTMDVKTPDRGTNVRVYFDNNREEVMTGRRFDIMGSYQWLCRQGVAYRFYTNVLLNGLPKHVEPVVKLTEDAKDGFGMMSYSIDPEGRVVYTVLAFRPVEMDQMVSMARLEFREDQVAKMAGSTRTRKTVSPKPAKEKGDAGGIPDKSTQDKEA